MTAWPRADHLARPDSERGTGKLTIVGIGPGLPEHLTEAARSALQTADAIYAAPLYQEFLAADGLLTGARDTDEPTVLDSSRDALEAQAIETFERVAAGETVVHVSGGDPTVYGKADLLLGLAETEATEEIPIEVVPGVTAGLGAAAALGAPLSKDFCTVSLSRTAQEQGAIDRKLEAAAAGGFVIVLYNVWRSLPAALSVISDHRSRSVPVAVLEDVARGETGRNPDGETVTVVSLAEATDEITTETPGTLAIVGTEQSQVFEPADGGQPFFLTPRNADSPLHDFDNE